MEFPKHCPENPEYNKNLVKKITDRIDTVEFVFGEIQKRGYLKNAYINQPILYTAIKAYYDDVDRHKCFHEIDLSDEHKKAAFSMKWLVKFRPIQLNDSVSGKSADFQHLIANELLALILALSLLGLGEEVRQISGKYIGNLIYCVRFREPNALVLASMFYLLQKKLKNEAV
jgi:hypothetical protein